MAAIVFRHDGVLAHFAGDAFEAFWNAPISQSDHAERAEDPRWTWSRAPSACVRVRGPRLAGPSWSRRGDLTRDHGRRQHRAPQPAGVHGPGRRRQRRGPPRRTEQGVRHPHRGRGGHARGRPWAFVYRFLDVVAVKAGGAATVYGWWAARGRCPATPWRAGRSSAKGSRLTLCRPALDGGGRVLRGLAVADAADGPRARIAGAPASYLRPPPRPDWDGVS